MTKDVLLLLAEWLDARRAKEESDKRRADDPLEGLFSPFSFDEGFHDRDDGDEVIEKAAPDVERLFQHAQVALEQLIEDRVNIALQAIIVQSNSRSAGRSADYHPCYPERSGRG